ncbi:MAG: paraquat-inducible protein A [Cyclobacteriaceae bacterium]
MSKRNILGFSLTLVSIGFLFPGLTFPMLTLEIGAEFPIVGKVTLYEQTQSILQTIETLHNNNNSIVAFLILFFSVIVPFFKAIILVFALFTKNTDLRVSLHKFVSAIGKWSMADVFVVGVFIAYLSTASNSAIIATLHEGFWYFTGYCLISLTGIQVMKMEFLKLQKLEAKG